MEGIKIHKIETNQFKTNLYAVFLATSLKRENVTKDALIAAVLRRGTMSIQSQDKISKELEEMYGASFDCGIEKTGDNHQKFAFDGSKYENRRECKSNL